MSWSCIAKPCSVLLSGCPFVIGICASLYVWAVCMHSLGAVCVHLCMYLCRLAGVDGGETMRLGYVIS